MALDDTAVIMITALAGTIVALACAFVLYAMRKREKKTPPLPKQETQVDPFLPSSSGFKVSKSVQSNDAIRAKDELRILDLEREILGDAIRHLYEAHAEGKINEQERDRLASSYKQRMMSVKEAMAKDETIVALHELEGMQEDLMKMFSERFGELSGKVEELRSRIDVKPIREIKVQMPKSQIPVMPDQLEKEEEEEGNGEEEMTEDKASKKIKKQQTERKPQKTEAEQRIDAIRNQIDEVMNKLGQMEMES